MRITNNMLSQNLLRNLESALGKMDNLQNQMSSGLRITKPSDDPVGIQNALRMKSGISAVEQWKSNADEALQFMYTTDSVMESISSMLQRVKELTVEGANGSLSVEDKNILALEVDQISEQLRITANTQIGSKYIFSGTKTDQELLKADGTWQGNDQAIKFEVGNNLSLPISVNGQTLFKTPLTVDPVTGLPFPGIFDTLSTLSTALKTDDTAGIQDALRNIDGNIDNVLVHLADLGARTNRITTISEQLDSTSLNLQQNLSDLEDANIAKTITDFKNQENVYKAALSVGAKIIQPSLVDFIS
ncbi:MAG TPA: flagellar hook-associated protein FlgL [Desulfitobacteriaceae bacterium]|jgi:flagellar hook-associated protein 3 FlgL|nr:flagellar hook-associated protein FlgL [Desulfitobacteriaceae bacterium]